MTYDELETLHKGTCAGALELMRAKNHDYSGAASDDRFRNFRFTEMLNVPAETGILIRLLDKVSRISTFIQEGKLNVKNESVFDAIDDIINYSILAKGVIMERIQKADENKKEQTTEVQGLQIQGF